MKAWLVALGALGLIAAGPPDPERHYREGVAARLAGDNERAIELLGRAAEAQPGNSDAHLQLGLALLAAGRLDQAELALRRTLSLAPDYVDAQTALDVLERRRRAGAGASSYRWRIDLDGNYSALRGGTRSDWREGSVQLRYEPGAATSILGAVEVSRRFGRTDVYSEARLDRRMAPGTSLYVSAGFTPNASFRPEWQMGLGGAARVRGGPSATVVTLDARQAGYRAGDIQTVSPGVEQYVAGGRAWLSGRWINIFDEAGRHHSGWLARGDLMASDSVRLFAGAADAPDVSEGFVTEAWSLFGGASIDISARITFRVSAAHEDRQRGGDRLQGSLGLGLRF